MIPLVPGVTLESSVRSWRDDVPSRHHFIMEGEVARTGGQYTDHCGISNLQEIDKIPVKYVKCHNERYLSCLIWKWEFFWFWWQLYIVSSRDRPWRHNKTLLIAHVTSVFSHTFKKESQDWCTKDAFCSVYPSTRWLMSQSFSRWDQV